MILQEKKTGNLRLNVSFLSQTYSDHFNILWKHYTTLHTTTLTTEILGSFIDDEPVILCIIIYPHHPPRRFIQVFCRD